ncbi:gamma-glutamyltransferase [Candidatus Marithrix sp. Canyon 246]|uniref:gamma-glutamyltransferase n=1 Tax=Candidatus Marithrix sp. Canyon 246 TaxID=1827136 RepID=UPI000849F8B7|nr:gamma-glutamyltransferase [Candidatus Marithrix sp. Canyon 246]
MKYLFRVSVAATSLMFATLSIAQTAIISERDIFTPTIATHGMVVTAEKMAAQIGVEVLQKGGNAVDAAVTIGFVKAVTYPRAGNLGGGGFMLIYSAKTKKVIAIDYREKAPLKATRDMFLDEKDNIDSNLSRFSYLSAGVPGTVAGMAMALEKYGTLSLAEALAPAIALAEKGFIITRAFSNDIKKRAKHLNQHPTTAAIFFKADGSFYQAGDRFVQNDLANTLKAIAKQGIKAFYEGQIADLIVKDMEAHGGLISKKDLAKYQPVIRKPIHGTYRGYDIYSMSPPSSGGVHIVQIMNMLENYDIGLLGHNTAATIHLMAEAMKRAYADRSKYLGDTDFVSVPLTGLTSKAYAAALGNPTHYESNETTHYSVVDKEGNAVSNTYTINFSFGSGIVVNGAGFLLNNEMDDFSAKPGVANVYGLIGGTANAIQPQKRMLSSMSPTIVLKDGKPFIITGSPGGSRIITTTLQVILNVIDHKMNIQEATNAVRIHHQWLPDEIRIEEGLSLDTIKLLTEKGHKVVVKNTMGAAASILIDQNTLYGSHDPRQQGLALGY